VLFLKLKAHIFSSSIYKQYILTISLLSIIFFLWYLLLFKQLNIRINKLKSEIQYLIQHNKLPTHIHGKPDATYYSQLYKEKMALLCGNYSQERLLWVLDLLAKNNIILRTCKPIAVHKAPRKNNDSYVIFFVQSNIYSLMHFFEQIAQSQYFIECLMCDIKKINDTLLSSKFLLKFSTLNCS
jgi:hypothetical protein